MRRVTTAEAGDRLELSGPWILRALEERLADLSRQLAEHARDANRHWDLSGVTRLDHAGALLLWRAWGGQRAARLTLRPEHEALFTGLERAPAAAGRHPRATGASRSRCSASRSSASATTCCNSCAWSAR